MPSPLSLRRALGRAVVAAALLVWAQGGVTQSQSEDGGVTQSPSPDEGNPSADAVGEELSLGPLSTAAAAPLARLITDSELVRGPSTARFDVEEYVLEQGGYLSNYYERVGGEVLGGVTILERVSRQYSVGPRALLVLIEMTSGWVRSQTPTEVQRPLGGDLPQLEPGLAEAAEALNAAYYGAKYRGDRDFALADGAVVTVPEANPGTFAVLAWLGRQSTSDDWAGLAPPSRFYATWTELFSDPLWYQIDPVVAEPLPPSDAQLPFPAGEMWFFVRGPHAPWGEGAAWSAIDFAPPPAESTTCTLSPYWVTASAPGLVTSSTDLGVEIDLDKDGFAETGWVHFYGHLSALERVAAGTEVRAGDRLGHPSCEGGASGTSRVTFARLYNGEWVPADYGEAPMVLGGWIPLRGSSAGEGFLTRAGLPPRPASPVKQAATNGIAVVDGQ